MISMLVLMVLLLLIIHFDNRTLHYNMAKLIVGLPRGLTSFRISSQSECFANTISAKKGIMVTKKLIVALFDPF